jgi:ABC-type dipeptide/oligopeptide/nickel transport system ATPase component
MQLLYIYLEDYLNFDKKQGFHFTSQYRFSVIEQPNTKTLLIEGNPNHIDNFFDNKSIIDVTALIGENGAGKSNIIEFIARNLPNLSNLINQKTLLVYEENNQLEIYQNIWGEVIVDNQTKTDYNKTSLIDSKYEASSSQREVQYIKYSNNFDLRFQSGIQNSFQESYESKRNQLLNITTQSLFGESRKEKSSDGAYSNEIQDRLDLFKLNELRRNIDFILNEDHELSSDVLGFEAPKQLIIDLGEIERQTKFEGTLNKLFHTLDDLSKKTKDKRQKFLIELARLVFIQLEEKVSPPTKFERIVFDQFNSLEELKSWIVEALNWLEEKTTDKQAKNAIKQFYILFDSIIEASNEFYLSLDVDKDNKAMSVNLNESKSTKFITKFYSAYVNSKIDDQDYLSFTWRALSSGEQSRLTLFSRFNFIKNKLNSDAETIIILIDEGDIYFHPEWQRQYLNLFIENIPKLLGSDKKYQFIFTANSPFLAADLPRDKVLKFEKVQFKDPETETLKRITRVVNDEQRTFAANIHTLLSDGFFLTSFLGEFAFKKIEAIAERLTDLESENKIEKKEQESIRRTIEAIGEPIIKIRLQQMFEERFGIPQESLTHRIKKLRAELEDLEELKKRVDDQD